MGQVLFFYPLLCFGGRSKGHVKAGTSSRKFTILLHNRHLISVWILVFAIRNGFPDQITSNSSKLSVFLLGTVPVSEDSLPAWVVLRQEAHLGSSRALTCAATWRFFRCGARPRPGARRILSQARRLRNVLRWVFIMFSAQISSTCTPSGVSLLSIFCLHTRTLGHLHLCVQEKIYPCGKDFGAPHSRVP